MPVSPETELLILGGGGPPVPDTAPMSVQIPRGLISGLSLGFAEPWQNQGKPGIPEHIARMVGSTAPMFLGVGALGSILRAAAPAIAASRPAMFGVSRFSGALPWAGATVGTEALESFNQNTPFSIPRAIGNAAVAGLLGGLVGRGKLKPSAAAATETATTGAKEIAPSVTPSGSAILNPPPFDPVVAARRLENVFASEQLGNQLRKDLAAYDVAQGTAAFPPRPVTPDFEAGNALTSRIMGEDATTALGRLDAAQRTASGGEIASAPNERLLSHALGEELRQNITAVERTPTVVGAEENVLNLLAIPSPRRTTILNSSEELAAYIEKRQRQMLPEAQTPAITEDSPKLRAELIAISGGGDAAIPEAQSAVLRATIGTPTSRWGRDLPQILAVGKLPVGIQQSWLYRKFATAKAVLAGTPGEKAPDLMNAMEGEMQRDTYDFVGGLDKTMKLSPSTRQTINRLFMQYADASPETFLEAAAKETNEVGVREALQQWRDVFDEGWRYSVENGWINPKRGVTKVTNYSPLIRDRKSFHLNGEVLVESGDGYFPRTIEALVPPRDPFFTKKRTFQDPTDFPMKISLEDRALLYGKQLARAKAMDKYFPEMQAMMSDMAQAGDDVRTEYLARLFNNFIGNRDPKLSDITQMMMRYNFNRSIAGSWTSPLNLLFNMVNAFAVADTTSFAKAFASAMDPAIVNRMHKQGVWQWRNLATAADIPALEGVDLPFWRRLEKFAATPFMGAERWNRRFSYAVGEHEAERLGLFGQEAADYAKQFTTDTTFIHTLVNRPELYRGSQIGRVLGQFSNFRTNQTHFMMRLVDEAREGVQAGDWTKVLPLVKYVGATTLLGGGAAITFGDIGEENVTRAVLGEAMHLPGVPEALFGVALRGHLGTEALGGDNLNSLLFFLPGPTISFATAMLGMGTGINLPGVAPGPLGRELNFHERMKLAMTALPAGYQIRRAIEFMRLIQDNGEYRAALDIGQALGLAPSQGTLLSQHAADTSEILGQLVGYPSAKRMEGFRLVQREVDLTADYNHSIAKAAEYLAGGDPTSASQIIERFNKKYADQNARIDSISPQAMQKAVLRKLLPPGAYGRERLPKSLLVAEPVRQLRDLQ